MVKIMFVLLIAMSSLYAKSNSSACIPIGKVVILKKSIMSLSLSKEQKKKLLKYEEKLKEDLRKVREDSKTQGEKLSDLFDKKQFLQKKFTDITQRENQKITAIISEYFSNMYATLTAKQKGKLIKRFKRIERKKRKK